MDLWISVGIFIGSILLITVFKSQFKGYIGELVVERSIKELDKEKYYKDTRDIKKKKISENICPKCGGKLVERDGKSGNL